MIRREKDYATLDQATRRKLFRYLLTFLRICDVEYKSFIFHKRQFANHDALVSRMSRDVGLFVRDNLAYLQSFDNVIVYYDGGQKEVTNIINAVFNAYLDADFRLQFISSGRHGVHAGTFRLEIPIKFIERL